MQKTTVTREILIFVKKTVDFQENQAFRGFREFFCRREKHVSKMCPGENFSFGSPNNFNYKFLHETQIKKSQKVDR